MRPGSPQARAVPRSGSSNTPVGNVLLRKNDSKLIPLYRQSCSLNRWRSRSPRTGLTQPDCMRRCGTWSASPDTPAVWPFRMRPRRRRRRDFDVRKIVPLRPGSCRSARGRHCLHCRCRSQVLRRLQLGDVQARPDLVFCGVWPVVDHHHRPAIGMMARHDTPRLTPSSLELDLICWGPSGFSGTWRVGSITMPLECRLQSSKGWTKCSPR